MKSTDQIRQQYLALYDQHGDTAKALDWGGEESQRTRFEVLCQVVPDMTLCSVLDVGCGLAHLADFIDDRANGVEFTGLDVTTELMAMASARRGDLETDTWMGLDIAALAAGQCPDAGRLEPTYDVVLASGLLADMDRGTAMQVIRWMFSKARVALAFNVQTWVPPGCSQLWMDPVLLADQAMKLSKRYVIRHDYAPHDATVYVYPDSTAAGWTAPSWSGHGG